MKTRASGFTLIELLIVVAIIGIIASIAIPNLLNAVDKGKQKRTMADMRSICTAIEAYAVDNTAFPIAASAAALKAQIDPTFIKEMPAADGWSNAFQVDSVSTSYTLYSQGKDGAGNSCPPGTTSNFNDEICLINGVFRRYPSGPQQ